MWTQYDVADGAVCSSPHRFVTPLTPDFHIGSSSTVSIDRRRSLPRAPRLTAVKKIDERAYLTIFQNKTFALLGLPVPTVASCKYVIWRESQYGSPKFWYSHAILITCVSRDYSADVDFCHAGSFAKTSNPPQPKK